MFPFRSKKRPPPRIPLMELAGEAIWEEEAAKNLFIFGAPGSGKSVLISQLMEQMLGIGKCVVVAVTNKPQDYFDYYALAKKKGVPVYRLGKEERGKIPPVRLDLGEWFTTGMKGGSPRVLAFEMAKAAEMCNPAKATGGDKFFAEASNDLLTAAINICILAGGVCDLKVVLDIARSLPTSAEQMNTQEFRESPCGKGLFLAERYMKPHQEETYNAALRLITRLASIGGKARSGIEQGALTTLQSLILEFGDRITGGSEYDIRATRMRPHLLIIDGQPLVTQASGQAFNYLGLAALQAEAKERHPDDVPFMTVAVIDEMPLNVHAQSTAQAMNVLRGQKWGFILAGQTLDLVIANLGGDSKADHEAKAIVTGCSRITFMGNSNSATNQFASELCGRGVKFLPSGGGSKPTGFLNDVVGVPGVGFSSQMLPNVESHEFSRLGVGEAVIVTRNGYRFVSFYEGKKR